MKRILLAMGVVCCLAGLTWTGAGQGYVGPEKVPFGAGRPLEIMGDRLRVAGKERLDMLGVLTRAGEDPVGVRILWEFPGKVRIEKQLATDDGTTDPAKKDVLVYDGAGNLRKRGGTAALADEDLIEMLVYDSVEGFFIGQIEGFATRFLGSGTTRWTRTAARWAPITISTRSSRGGADWRGRCGWKCDRRTGRVAVP